MTRPEAKRQKVAVHCARKLRAAVAAINTFSDACAACNDGSQVKRSDDSRVRLADDMSEYAGWLERRYGATLMLLVACVAFLSGCATDPRKNDRCFLLAVAYEEQDELATGWYDSAARELKRCGFKFEHSNGSRGFGPDGYINPRTSPEGN